MRKNIEVEFVNWLLRNGKTKRKDLPKEFVGIDENRFKLFSVSFAKEDADGYPISSGDDIFFLSDDNYKSNKKHRIKQIHEFRDWLEPTGIVIANLIAIAALIVSIIALNA